MWSRKKVVVIVAHPDDEILWAGGTLLGHPEWELLILCLCRKNDPDRAPKFEKAVAVLNAEGIMEDLDDGPLQSPQDINYISDLIMGMLPTNTFDLIMTHNPLGEYTRHLRHEEIGKAVLNLWLTNRLSCNEFLFFAYEDGNRMYFPKASNQANLYYTLPAKLWQLKYKIMTGIYGFRRNSWEAKTVPTSEAFWRFTKKKEAIAWLKENSVL
ncbi:PIG-L family deacetylase [Pedobacter gandavensis]|uniref:PIG-L deacetylase family protein n=1 Tax=Pedobacter TaxID=84567 RepID=UPI001C9A207A|nr:MULTISPECIES: PIG-L family deacetylase [Pedobacter]WGQ09825.1 PIG-L family deacetylase [Pedobacter gandavensis]